MSMLGLNGERNGTTASADDSLPRSGWYSPKGRINRKKFAWSFLYAFGLWMFIGGTEIGAYQDLGHASDNPLLPLLFLFSLYLLTVSAVKRSRDVGWSGWLALVGPLIWLPLLFIRSREGRTHD